MSIITIKIPRDKLEEPEVAEALAALMLALGSRPKRRATTPTIEPESTSLRLAKTPPLAPTSTPEHPPSTAPRSRQSSKRGRTTTKAATTAGQTAITAGKAQSAPNVSTFRQRADLFLAIVESRGTVTLSEIVSNLGLRSRGSVGSVIAAVSRRRGKHSDLPFTAGRDDAGERIYVWNGGPTASPKPSKTRSKAKPTLNASQLRAILGPKSQAFMDLVERRGTATASEVGTALGFTHPKTLGGTVGSIVRAFNSRGLPLPFDIGRNSEGERLWTWRRVAGTPKGVTAAESAPPKRTERAASGSTKQEQVSTTLSKTAPERGSTARVSDQNALNARASLATRSQDFIDLLEANGSATLSEALTILGLQQKPRSIDGLIGEVFRAYRARGLEPPFGPGKPNQGERSWVWLAKASLVSAPKTTQSKTAPKRRQRGAASSKPTSSPYSRVGLTEFVAGLPKRSQQFLELVRSRGTVTVSEVARALNAASNQAVGGITGSTVRSMRKHGIDVPYEAGKSDSGERTWTWLDSPDEAPLPETRAKAVRPIVRRANRKGATVAKL